VRLESQRRRSLSSVSAYPLAPLPLLFHVPTHPFKSEILIVYCHVITKLITLNRAAATACGGAVGIHAAAIWQLGQCDWPCLISCFNPHLRAV
jgi:hypothetical protein